MRKLIALFVFMALTSNVKSSGIPVVDIAKINQDMQQYIQQIADFSEQVSQGVVQGNQYTQMLQDYAQTLQEYAHYLDQLRGLQQFISAADWATITAMVLPSWGDAVNGLIAGLDTASPNFDTQLDAILSVTDYQPESVGDMVNNLNSILGYNPNTAEFVQRYGRIEAQYDSYRGLMNTVAYNSKVGQKMRNRINTNIAQVRNLGNQSDLATQQMMAMQNIMIMQQLDHNNTINNQILMRTELEQAREASEIAQAIKDQQAAIIKQLNKADHSGVNNLNTSGF